MIQALPCIVCGRALSGCATPNQPLDGLSFSAIGHYGTTVFDPMDGSSLEINVCDPCLASAGSKGQVLRYDPPGGASRPQARAWRPDGDQETEKGGQL